MKKIFLLIVYAFLGILCVFFICEILYKNLIWAFSKLFFDGNKGNAVVLFIIVAYSLLFIYYLVKWIKKR
jgi:hypothetical protein